MANGAQNLSVIPKKMEWPAPPIIYMPPQGIGIEIMAEKPNAKGEIEITDAMAAAGAARIAAWFEVPNDWLMRDLAKDVCRLMLAARLSSPELDPMREYQVR